MKKLSIYGIILKNIKEEYTMKRNLWQTFKNACVIFSVIIFIYLIGLTFVNTKIQDITTIVFLFFFSLVISFINEIFFVKRFSLIIKLIIHFFSTLAVILIGLAVSGKFAENGFAIIILSFAFAVIYWIGASVALIINGAKGEKKNTEQKYDKMFK